MRRAVPGTITPCGPSCRLRQGPPMTLRPLRHAPAAAALRASARPWLALSAADTVAIVQPAAVIPSPASSVAWQEEPGGESGARPGAPTAGCELRGKVGSGDARAPAADTSGTASAPAGPKPPHVDGSEAALPATEPPPAAPAVSDLNTYSPLENTHSRSPPGATGEQGADHKAEHTTDTGCMNKAESTSKAAYSKGAGCTATAECTNDAECTTRSSAVPASGTKQPSGAGAASRRRASCRCSAAAPAPAGSITGAAAGVGPERPEPAAASVRLLVRLSRGAGVLASCGCAGVQCKSGAVRPQPVPCLCEARG